MKVLEVENIRKKFYDPIEFEVLKGISFDVKKGEFLSLVGKSGSGKSTLLYVLSTMDTDFTGRLAIDGTEMSGLGIDRLAKLRNEKIGFIFQFHYLLGEFSCLRNVMLPALKLGKYKEDEIEHRAIQKLEMLGLSDQALKPASKLSGGQQQRVAIARALINDPLIIMGDEPTGNLDSKNTEIVFEILKDLAQQYHQTIIAVTHDLDFARSCDRIIELSDGEIVPN
ncbi:MAG: ABC transporter ATP-binding protein [Bacteroidia bacterium]|jgi:lipoprotein-releasing system ATP-binding protein